MPITKNKFINIFDTNFEILQYKLVSYEKRFYFFSPYPISKLFFITTLQFFLYHLVCKFRLGMGCNALSVKKLYFARWIKDDM